MGRRTLRKIDPAIDLSRYYVTFEQLPKPWDAATLFQRTAPLEIEVGSGKGLFLRSAAAATPQCNFLGIELARKYAQYAALGLARSGLTNAKVADADALRVFAELLPEAAAVAVHVYFPDPWWKQRHRKRRVMQGPFLRDIERVLQPGGSLHFWTDVEEYFQAGIASLKEETRLAGPFAVAERTAEHDLDYRTHFERRMRQHREAVFRSEFRKPS